MKPVERPKGRAPHIAKSFRVPCTASEPMSPPGKKRGLTTKESVEKASRVPFISNKAPSWRISRAGLSNAPRNIFSISIWVSRPPPPCASSTVGYWLIGIGHCKLKSTGVSWFIPVSRTGSRRHTLPQTRPSARPEDSLGCKGCRRPYTGGVF